MSAVQSAFGVVGRSGGLCAGAREVVEVVAGYAVAGAVVLKGNHDGAIEGGGGYFNDAGARGTAMGTRDAHPRAKRFPRFATA